jgi:hypothetical protein
MELDLLEEQQPTTSFGDTQQSCARPLGRDLEEPQQRVDFSSLRDR